MTIYALTFEYSYANNLDGTQSPDEAGGVLDLYEDEDDAKAGLKKAEGSGDWGDFSDENENDGWSSPRIHSFGRRPRGHSEFQAKELTMTIRVTSDASEPWEGPLDEFLESPTRSCLNLSDDASRTCAWARRSPSISTPRSP